MACYRCGIWNLAFLLLVLMTTHVYTADPNVEEVPAVDGVKLICPSTVPTGSPVNWKGPDGSQLNAADGTFADARLSYVAGRDLQMANATPSDNGIYTCVIGAQEGQVNLTVYVTSAPKLKMSFEGEFFDSSTGQTQIRTDNNASQTVTCMIQGAFPMPEIFIHIRDHNDSIYSSVLSADITIQSNQEDDNTYTVNASTTVVIDSILYNNRRIECLAVFTFDGKNESAMASASFYLNKIEPTLLVYSGFRTLDPSDNTLRFTCHAERSRSEIEAVTAYIDGAVLAPPYNFSQTPVKCTVMQELNQYYTYLYACNSTIEIYGITKMDNEKSLNCDFTYQNRTIGGNLGANQKIDFRFPPTMVNITGNSPVEVSGNSMKYLTLKCETDSSNTGSALMWYNGTSELTNSESATESTGMYGGVTTTENLMLPVNRYMDGNVIRCSADHFRLKDKLFSSVTLNVSYSPEIVQPVSSVYRVYSQQSITIPCSAVAKPAATVKWYRIYSVTNKTEVKQDTYMSNGNRQLYFEYTLQEHAGDYECMAENVIQPAVSQRITLHVYDTSSLQAFDIIKLTPSRNSIVLEFNKPTDRAIQYLFLQYTTLNAIGEPGFVQQTEIALNENYNTVSVTLNELQPATTYSLRLKEVGAKYGLVATTFLRTVTTPAASEDEYTRKDLNTAIIVSVIVTAVVVALFCVIIFCLIKKGVCCASSNERYEMQMKPRA